MPKFEIEQYEIHAQKYTVEADTMAEAVDRVLNGDSDSQGALEYVEVAEDIGMSLDANEALVEELEERGHSFRDCLSSIRSVTQVD